MSNDVELDYPSLMDHALRAVVRDVLNITAELGAVPGDHHFYIEFQTNAPGVDIPDTLRANYPERMTIVLQHQFKDLLIEDEKFTVTLWFKGEPSKLVIPFDAVTTFADPSVQFELRYAENGNPVFASSNLRSTPLSQEPTMARAVQSKGSTAGRSGSDEKAATSSEPGSGRVVSLDAFRKNNRTTLSH